MTGRIQEEDEYDSNSLLDETPHSRVSRNSKIYTGTGRIQRERNDEYDYDEETIKNFRVSMKPKIKSTGFNLSAQNLFMGTSLNDNNSDSDSS